MTWKPHPRKDILVSCEGITLRQAFRDAEQEARAEILKSKERLSAVRVVIQLRDMTKPPPVEFSEATKTNIASLSGSMRRAYAVYEYMQTGDVDEVARKLGVPRSAVSMMLNNSARKIEWWRDSKGIYEQKEFDNLKLAGVDPCLFICTYWGVSTAEPRP